MQFVNDAQETLHVDCACFDVFVWTARAALLSGARPVTAEAVPRLSRRVEGGAWRWALGAGLLRYITEPPDCAIEFPDSTAPSKAKEQFDVAEVDAPVRSVNGLRHRTAVRIPVINTE